MLIVEKAELFLDTLEDLRRRTDLRAAEYDMVQAAGLIRRLVFDQASLWVEVNREYRTKPRCSWQRMYILTRARNGDVWIPSWWIDPEIYDANPLHRQIREQGSESERLAPWTGSIDSFLKHLALRRGDDHATVGELILHYAHWEGGVHYKSSPPKSNLIDDVRVVSEESLRLTVLAIGRIIYAALMPLAVRIVLERYPHPRGISGMKIYADSTLPPSP